MRFLLKYALLSVIILFSSIYFSSIFTVDNYKTALVLALIMGFVNTFLKPVLKLISFPIQLLTLGLFTLIINGLLVLSVDWFLDGFIVTSFLAAIIFGTVITLISGLLNTFLDKD